MITVYKVSRRYIKLIMHNNIQLPLTSLLTNLRHLAYLMKTHREYL